jgi:hypothetical protein
MLTQVMVTHDVYEGIVNASQSYGLAGMRPNTVIMGWGEESERPDEFTNLVRTLLALDHNLLFLEYDEVRAFGDHETIDIWWGGLERNGDLMLLLAYLITSSDTWRDASVKINVIVDTAIAYKQTEESLAAIIKDSRVTAEANIIPKEADQRPISDYIAETSANTDLVIMGLREPRPDEAGHFVDHVGELIERLGTVLLVRSSTQFKGASLLFDEE